MTYKAAMAGLPLGGGKSVIIGDSRRDKSPALFRAFGRAVEDLGGRYITGEDVGTNPDDMALVAEETRHVAGLAQGSGDPSPVTAYGVFLGIQAVAKHRLGRDTLHGLTVAVQGAGHVGYHLCRSLHEAGASLVVTDVNAAAVDRVVNEFDARAVASDAIFAVEADILAPCALGGAINDETLPLLKVAAVAGAANNQLAEPRHGDALARRGILYAPDYVINAGGLINIAWDILDRGPYDHEQALAQVRHIHDTLLDIFARSDAEGRPPHEVADAMARDRLAKLNPRRYRDAG
jgi:leucine dehydrogenase